MEQNQNTPESGYAQEKRVHFFTLRCPECGASLEVENNRDIIFCTYCGCKLKIYNDNEHFIKTEKIYRNIDDAQIYRAETERMMQMKYSEQRKKLSSGAILGIVLLLLGFITVIGTILASNFFESEFFALVILMGLGIFVTGIVVLIKTKIIDRDY